MDQPRESFATTPPLLSREQLGCEGRRTRILAATHREAAVPQAASLFARSDRADYGPARVLRKSGPKRATGFLLGSLQAREQVGVLL